jgi:phage tail tape-measure protein
LKLTVDSNEPLEDAMRVVGALYGVTLVVSNEGVRASEPTRQRAHKPRQRSTGAKPRKLARVESAVDPNNADVRSWARRTGLTVSGRGRVPASVMAAYRSAHQ